MYDTKKKKLKGSLRTSNQWLHFEFDGEKDNIDSTMNEGINLYLYL